MRIRIQEDKIFVFTHFWKIAPQVQNSPGLQLPVDESSSVIGGEEVAEVAHGALVVL